MGLKGQRDQFAETHLLAPALFTHHLRSERQASGELSGSHNTTALLVVVLQTQRPAAFFVLFIICSFNTKDLDSNFMMLQINIFQ